MRPSSRDWRARSRRQRRSPRRPPPPRTPPRAGRRQPPKRRPGPSYRPPGRRPGRVYVHEPYPVAYPEPEPTPEPIQEPGSEHSRWVQDCLNRIFALRLPVNGILDAASRSAIRRLQKQESLPITGIVSPGTEQALQRLCGEGDAPADPESQGEWGESEWEWEGEVNRNSRDYIRWVQASLNKILGTRLTVDGVMRAQTRSAIRSFQKRQRLKVDGIVGRGTEAALIAAGAGSSPLTAPVARSQKKSEALRGVRPAPGVSPSCPPRPIYVDCPPPGTPFEVLDNFAFNGFRLKPPLHTPRIIRIASEVVASQGSSQPIRSLLIAGHTDPVGDDNYNFLLGRQRAEEVMRELCKTLEGMRPGLAGSIAFQLTTCGERQTKPTPEQSRRVEVFLPKKVAPPPPPPPPPSPLPPTRCLTPLTPPGITPAIPVNISDLLRLVRLIVSSLPAVVSSAVKLPTAARFLDAGEQSEARTIYGPSLDFTKILIADGLGFQKRVFTVAVPLSAGSHVVMMMGDLCSWATRPRSATLIHRAGPRLAIATSRFRCAGIHEELGGVPS